MSLRNPKVGGQQGDTMTRVNNEEEGPRYLSRSKCLGQAKDLGLSGLLYLSTGNRGYVKES